MPDENGPVGGGDFSSGAKKNSDEGTPTHLIERNNQVGKVLTLRRPMKICAPTAPASNTAAPKPQSIHINTAKSVLMVSVDGKIWFSMAIMGVSKDLIASSH